MGNHTITHFAAEYPESHWAVCTCRWRTQDYLTKQLVEDEVFRHQQYIEKVRTHLGTRTPSLAQQRAYFRARAQDPHEDAKWVPIWQQMADELDQRLNDGAHAPYDQLNLNLSEDEPA